MVHVVAGLVFCWLVALKRASLTLSLVRAFHRNRPRTLSMLFSSGFCRTLTSRPQEPGVVISHKLSVSQTCVVYACDEGSGGPKYIRK